MCFCAAVEMPLHMFVVEFATFPTETTTARKTRPNIRPYSTAVAALVDRISL